MQEQLKNRWIEALENQDGRYKKTDQGLHVGDCHCGLGVLCDVMELPEFKDTSDYFGYKYADIQNGEDWRKHDLETGDMVTGLCSQLLNDIELSQHHHSEIMSLNDVDEGDSYQSVIDYIRVNV